jgi:hypothetical protein
MFFGKLRPGRCPWTLFSENKTDEEVWAMDVMADQLFDSTELRILTVVGLFTWFARQRKSSGLAA